MKKKETATEKVLLDMLLENTGSHMLDSGGAYGRNWSRNQALGRVALRSVPPVIATFSSRGIGVSIDVFQFLKEQLEIAALEDGDFQTFLSLPEHENDSWKELIEKWARFEGRRPTSVGNSYNGESALSQVIQYNGYVDHEHNSYVVLQIHQGCDVRGGYTKPVVFNGDPDSLSCVNQATIRCGKNPEHMWTTHDAGYKWEAHVSDWTVKDLDEYPIVEIDDSKDDEDVPDTIRSRLLSVSQGVEQLALYLERFPSKKGDATAQHNKSAEILNEEVHEILSSREHRGTVWVLPGGIALCPVCGGELGVCL